MPESPIIRVRVPPAVLARIEVQRNGRSRSAWLRETIARRLEADMGLGPEALERLETLNRQLRGLGTNLNQLAKLANQGERVRLDPTLLARVDAGIAEGRRLLRAVHAALAGAY